MAQSSKHLPGNAAEIFECVHFKVPPPNQKNQKKKVFFFHLGRRIPIFAKQKFWTQQPSSGIWSFWFSEVDFSSRQKLQNQKFQWCPFCFFAVPISQKFYLLPQFSRYQDAVCVILLITKLRYNKSDQNFEFFPQSKKKILKKIQTLEGSKIFGARDRNSVPTCFCAIQL